MLKKSKKIVLDGRSVIDDVEIVGFRASIDTENPGKHVNVQTWDIKKDAVRENIKQIREDRDAFEDAVYALQDELTEAASNEE